MKRQTKANNCCMLTSIAHIHPIFRLSINMMTYLIIPSSLPYALIYGLSIVIVCRWQTQFHLVPHMVKHRAVWLASILMLTRYIPSLSTIIDWYHHWNHRYHHYHHYWRSVAIKTLSTMHYMYDLCIAWVGSQDLPSSIWCRCCSILPKSTRPTSWCIGTLITDLAVSVSYMTIICSSLPSLRVPIIGLITRLHIRRWRWCIRWFPSTSSTYTSMMHHVAHWCWCLIMHVCCWWL